MEIAFLLHFIGLCITVFGFNVPQEWIIGLREGHTIEEHLAVVERSIDIEQYIPEINGYAIYPTEDDEATLSAIRRDLKVGFSVQKPREFFTQDGHFGLEGDDLSEYEDERLWLTLQDQDSEVIVTDDNATKIPLTWRIFFTDKTAKEEHILTVGKTLHITYVLTRSCWVVFDDQIQERRYLSLIKSDSSVTAVYPERTRQGIFYDEVEGSIVKPYAMDDIVIHEGI